MLIINIDSPPKKDKQKQTTHTQNNKQTNTNKFKKKKKNKTSNILMSCEIAYISDESVPFCNG